MKREALVCELLQRSLVELACEYIVLRQPCDSAGKETVDKMLVEEQI